MDGTCSRHLRGQKWTQSLREETIVILAETEWIHLAHDFELEDFCELGNELPGLLKVQVIVLRS